MADPNYMQVTTNQKPEREYIDLRKLGDDEYLAVKPDGTSGDILTTEQVVALCTRLVRQENRPMYAMHYDMSAAPVAAGVPPVFAYLLDGYTRPKTS